MEKLHPFFPPVLSFETLILTFGKQMLSVLRRWTLVEIKLSWDLMKRACWVNVYPGLASHQGRLRSIPIVLRVHSLFGCDWWLNAYLHAGVIDGSAQGCALRWIYHHCRAIWWCCIKQTFLFASDFTASLPTLCKDFVGFVSLLTGGALWFHHIRGSKNRCWKCHGYAIGIKEKTK